MVIRRTLAIAGLIPSFTPRGAPSGGQPFDSDFSRHPVITFIHMLPGALFLILGPMQFTRRTRERPNNGIRIAFIFAGYIVGISALCLPFVLKPIGGLNEAAASTLFAIYFLIALSRTWWHLTKGNTALCREWIIRAYAIGLAIATVRPIMGIFFAFSGLQPQVFFGTAFWLGFTIHAMAAEVFINCTRNPENLKFVRPK